MKMHDYRAKYDTLAYERQLYEIPGRKEHLLSWAGRGKRVLDVGCSGGMLSKLFQEANNEVWGVELNPEAARVARARGVRVKIANVEDGLPFPDGEFDVVHAGEILDRLFDTLGFLEECHRVLKREGLLLFTAPNVNSLENRLCILLGLFPRSLGAFPEDHFGDQVRVFNRQKIQELCRRAGFEVDELRGIPPLKPGGRWTGPSARFLSMRFPGLAKTLLVKAKKADFRPVVRA